MILKSELSSKHSFESITSYDIHVLLNRLTVLNWTFTVLKIIDRESRKMLQQYHAIHRQSDATRLYLPRKNDGGRIINITNTTTRL